MALETTTTQTLAYQRYFIKNYLKYAKPLCILDQLCYKKHMPYQSGATQVTFLKPPAVATAQITTPSEGVYAAVNRTLVPTRIDIQLAQRFQDARISDITLGTHIMPIMDMGVQMLKDDFALDYDTLLRNQWVADQVAAASVTYTRFSGVSAPATVTAGFTSLSALTQAQGALVVKDLLDARTALMLARAPTFDGDYLAAVPSQCLRDILVDTTFVNASSYSNLKPLYNGEFGKYYGVRVLETTNPFRQTSGGTYGTQSAAGTGIFQTIISGQQSFGVADLFNQPSLAPKVYVIDKPDKSDPANQFVIIATKRFEGYKSLDLTWSVHNLSKSVYGG